MYCAGEPKVVKSEPRTRLEAHGEGNEISQEDGHNPMRETTKKREKETRRRLSLRWHVRRHSRSIAAKIARKIDRLILNTVSFFVDLSTRNCGHTCTYIVVFCNQDYVSLYVSVFHVFAAFSSPSPPPAPPSLSRIFVPLGMQRRILHPGDRNCPILICTFLFSLNLPENRAVFYIVKSKLSELLSRDP